MRIISLTRLKEFWEARPEQANAERPLRQWHGVLKSAAWKTPADVKRTFGKNVDFVTVASGNTVAVFNIHGNAYRLIGAIYYLPANTAKGRVYVLRVLTHQEYDENRWKAEL